MSEKTHKATPWKLQKAREQGQVSKSTDLNTCVFLLVLLALTAMLWPACLQQIKGLLSHLLSISTRVIINANTFSRLQAFYLSEILSGWLPFALAGILALCLSSIAQTGFVWSGKALKPDFKRLDLVQGFKRAVSSKLLFETFKHLLKSSLVFLLMAYSVQQELPAFIHFLATRPSTYPALLMAILLKLSLQLILVLFASAFIDKLYTRWKFAKDTRMNSQEVKDEYRQHEGDPQIKQKTKQLQNQLRQKTASLEQIKKADVLITNPTHLAVALKYQRNFMPAPQLVCKVQGELVTQAKKIALRYRVPIIENKTFARSLFDAVGLNQWIQREHFPMAAMIFRELMTDQ